MKKKNGCKFLSLFLVFVLIFSIITTGFIPAYAAEENLESYQAEAVGNPEIIAFGELTPEIAVQDEGISVTDAVYASDVESSVDETPPVPGGSGIISIQSYYATNQKIILTWTKATDDVSDQNQLKYYVYRSAEDNIRTVEECEANGELQNAGGSMDIGTFSWAWQDYTNTYYYNVIAEDGAGNKAAYQPVVRNGIQITQSQSVTLLKGYTSYTLSVSAFSDPEEPISYQWYYNTMDTYGSNAIELHGYTEKNFTLPDDLAAGYHYYFCKISIKGGSIWAYSNSIAVKVLYNPEAPSINGPTEMTLAEGYHDTYTNAYSISGTLPITVVKKSGHEKITWDETSKRLKITSGLPKGTYPVLLEASHPSGLKKTFTFTLTVINDAVLSGEVTIEGTPKFGETLSVDTSKLTIIPAITVTGDLIYEWRRSGSETIIGSESTYIISKEDIGKTITVTVKATDCDGFVATSPVNVEKADGSVIAAITGGYTGNGVTFTYRVNSIDNAEYSMDGIQWQESNEFDGFTIDSSPTTFYARIKETQTHKAGPYASIGPVTFIKLDNPQVPILDYTVSQEGDGRSINIMPVDNAEYKFGDEPWSGVFSKGGYIGGETVTIHIRYKETGTHNASMPNSITVNLEKANQEAPPVFKLNYTYNKKIGVFRVWIPEIPGAEYSFDGIVYDQTRTKIAAPGTTVTAYMRMKATQSHNESPAVSDTVTLPIFATSIIVSGMNGKSSITTKDGALQMLAKVLPEGASQDVIWSIVSGTGASINTSGLLQATGNGTVIVRATATDGTDVYGEMQVSISGQSSRGGSSGGRDSSYYERRSSSEGISQIEIKVFENNVTAIITVKETNDRDGNWVAPFSLEQISDAVDKAMKEAEKIGEGAIVNVVLKVEATANATTIENITPKEAVTKASKAGINSLTISTPVGSITFDSNTISDLSEKAAGDLKIKINRVDASSLLPEAQQIVGDRPVYDIIVTGGDKSISQFGGNVTVSVSYTPKEGEDTNAIVIYYINASGQLEVVTNGKYDPVTGMVTFTTRHFSKYAVGYHKIDFKDVDENAWYSKAVSFIAAREITTGTGDGNFNPEAKLTRGQFIVMFMKAYGIAPDTESKDNFADAVDTYYSGYLAAAKGLSISNGVGYNMFEPEKEITRQEMFTLLYNGLKAIARLPVGMTDKSLASFVDADSIEPWAKEAMKYLVVTGIIGGSGDKLNPTKTTTRGEMVQVLYNLLTRAN